MCRYSSSMWAHIAFLFLCFLMAQFRASSSRKGLIATWCLPLSKLKQNIFIHNTFLIDFHKKYLHCSFLLEHGPSSYSLSLFCSIFRLINYILFLPIRLYTKSLLLCKKHILAKFFRITKNMLYIIITQNTMSLIILPTP